MSLSINREISEKIGAPRTVFVRFPHGAPFGEPGAKNQRMTVLRDLLRTLQGASEPGVVVEPGHRWRRTEYPPVAVDSFSAG